jgi:hypothetical protein
MFGKHNGFVGKGRVSASMYFLVVNVYNYWTVYIALVVGC